VELRRKSGPTALNQCSSRTVTFVFVCLPSPADVVRPRSCALRLRRFSRNSTARRWLRGNGFAVLLSFSPDVMSRIIGSPANVATCGTRLAPAKALWQFPPRSRRFHSGWARSRCRSSVVEHPLGKGEVECSIHSGSTSKPNSAEILNQVNRYETCGAGSERQFVRCPADQIRLGEVWPEDSSRRAEMNSPCPT